MKSLGLGSSSLFIAIFAILFNYLSIRGLSLGEYLLSAYNLSPLFYDIVGVLLFLLAWFIGKKHNNDKFAKLGVILSSIFLVLYIIFAVIGLIQHIIHLVI
ncbi:hypothetical protein G4V62_14555 [Bacillaceae bacterium SIJ1]|uniref:hypothetical protein n=1 Tax=Litoribacterium kuwaitense TaxID=1398745 RepID=UPI0013EADD76|nr:hypothetical protein [Litoribacterium kuwaitense]NGP46113.1 hypothetical protein [Litoribacterium kuwaitense]